MYQIIHELSTELNQAARFLAALERGDVSVYLSRRDSIETGERITCARLRVLEIEARIVEVEAMLVADLPQKAIGADLNRHLEPGKAIGLPEAIPSLKSAANAHVEDRAIETQAA